MKFTDSLNRKWQIEIDVTAVKKLRDELDLDLMSLLNKSDDGPNLLQRLADDPVLLVDTLSVLLSDQIEEEGLDAIGFAKGLRGEAIAEACDALMEEIANFFRPQKGQMIRNVYTKVKSIASEGSSKLMTILDSPEMEARLKQDLDKAIQQAQEAIRLD